MTATKQQNHTGPFTIMVGLFFIVGFLTVVNQQFQAPLKDAFLANAGSLQNTLTTFITFAFFMGYPVMGNISARWVDKHGYRKTLVYGLLMLVGALGIFELSAWGNSFLGTFTVQEATLPYAFIIFFIGSFFLGCALAVLQVVINPYLANCSVPGTSSMTRITIGGASNSIGTTAAPFFVGYLIFGGDTIPQVDQLYIPFAVLMVAIFIVAMIVGKLNLPNIEGTTADDNAEPLTKSVWSFKHLLFGVIGIFVYVGAEVAIGANISLYGKSLDLPKETYTLMAALYWGSMLIGRLCGSFLSKVAGKTQLLWTSLVAAILVAAAMILNQPWLLVGAGLAHSIMWGAIFSLAIDKLGPYTSKASGALMIGVAGGAVIPWIQGITADFTGWQATWVIVILCELYLVWYAVSGHKHNLK